MATADLPPLSRMTPEAKRELLGALLLDMAAGETNVLSVEAGGRAFTVYVPPPGARELARQAMAATTPDEWDDLLRRADDPDPTHWATAEELIRSLRSGGDR